MSTRNHWSTDPEKRKAKAARRKIRKAQEAAGVELVPRQKRRSGLTDHGSSPRKRAHAREGEKQHHRERGMDQ